MVATKIRPREKEEESLVDMILKYSWTHGSLASTAGRQDPHTLWAS